MALAMLRLIAFTLAIGFVCYLVGLVLRKFVPRYQNFQYRFSLPIIACCFGGIAALLLTAELMSLFLVDCLYRFSLVRQHPALIIGALDVTAYVLGAYYSTKYSADLARSLDLQRATKKARQKARSVQVRPMGEVGRDLLGRND
jgi:hypothetical protein